MTKRIFLLIVCLNILPVYIFAQQKWKPGFVAEAGLQAGSYEPSADLRAQFLMAKRGWQVGAGSGVDYYRFRSVPVYVQGRKYFGTHKSKPFAMLSAGVNIASVTEAQKNNRFGGIGWWNPIPASYTGGFYGEAGGGYAFLNKKGRGVSLSLSYVMKSISESYTTSYWLGFSESEPTQEKATYYMNRLVFRVGYKF
jgi:hypothetical protein